MKWTVPRKRYIPCTLPMVSYYRWPAEEEIGMHQGSSMHIWDKGYYYAVWSEEGKEAFTSFSFKEHMERNPEEIRREAFEAGEKVVGYCKEFVDNLESHKLEDFIDFIEEYRSLYSEFSRKSVTYWFLVDEVVEEKINEALEGREDAEEIWNVMSIPEEESYSQRMEEEFLKIVEKAEQKGIDAVSEEIKEFSDKYIWFPYEYSGPEIWDFEAVKKRVKNYLESESEIKKKDKVDKKKFAEKQELSNEIMKLFEILENITMIQDDRKMLNAKCCYYVNHLVVNRLSEILDIPRKHMLYLDENVLKEDNVAEELRKRSELLVYVDMQNRDLFLTGQDAEEKIKEVGLKKEVSDVDEIRGSPASRGVARGPVKILKTSNEKGFKEGDILVTGMTTPDFITLMKKAGGIVTDEGGVTSHAAIVSRELGKPCVIGTQNATDVLEDGNIVEVDANEGIVKKIK